MSRGTPVLSVLDVGHGNAAVLQDTEGVVVVDAGPRRRLLDFLLDEGIDMVDVLLLSHADADHIGGAIELLLSDEVGIGVVYVNPDSTKDSAQWDDLLYALQFASQSKEVRFEIGLTKSLTGTLDQGAVAVEVLAPSQYLVARGPGSRDRSCRPISTNTISAVVRFARSGDRLVMLAGDIDRTGLDNLLEEGNDLESRALVFPHHGGTPGTGSAREFTELLVESVRPDWVVFSIRSSEESFPNPDVVSGIRTLRPQARLVATRKAGTLSDEDANDAGTVHFDLAENPMTVRSERSDL